MSYFTAERRAFADAEERRERASKSKPKPAAKSKPAPGTASRELQTLADPSASDADKFKAWLKVGLSLGAVELRHIERLGVSVR